jgi:hypothetical protein
MATAALHPSRATRRAVASWISSATTVLLAALVGVVAAAQLRLIASLLGETWLGARAWLR